MIKKLPDCIISRIAAGEVITSPCNALKELLENSLDAGATAVSIELSSGLLSFSVEDNGCGMGEEDLRVACKNNYTSKIASLEDLANINRLGSFGFRGEALHSVGLSARLTVVSRSSAEQILGHRVEYAGTDPALVSRVPRERRGTRVEVTDLFYRNIIRKEYFYRNKTECSRCIGMVQAYACLYAGISLSVDGKLVLAPCEGPHQVLALCHANEYANEHFRICDDAGAVPSRQKSALQSKLNFIRRVFLEPGKGAPKLEWCLSDQFLAIFTGQFYSSGRSTFILFVNRRLVRNEAFKRRVLQKYRSVVGGGCQPAVYIEIVVEYADVNVHPSKSEVQIEDEKLFDEILAAVGERLSGVGRFVAAESSAADASGASIEDSMTQSMVLADESILSERSLSGRSFCSGPGDVVHPASRIYSSPLVQSIEEAQQNSQSQCPQHARRVVYSLSSLKRLRDEVVCCDSSFVRELVYVGCCAGHIFVQHSLNLLRLSQRLFLRECFLQKVLRDFGNFETREIPPWRAEVDETLQQMLREYFGIVMENGCIVGAPVLYGVVMPDWSGFSLARGTEYETLENAAVGIASVYEAAVVDGRLFNKLRQEAVCTASLLGHCKMLFPLRQLYKKFGRC